MADLWRAIRCWIRWCPGRVVSGIHGRIIWIGWRCADCGKVKHYAPSLTRESSPSHAKD